MSRPIVLYHGGCFDGFCAAWLLYRAFPDAELIPVNYGNPPPEVAMDRGRPLYVVDFSYDRSTMFKLAAMRHEEMIVLDHHKTAQQALDGLEVELASNNCGDALSVTFDLTKSGGRLTWEYLEQRFFGQAHPFNQLVNQGNGSAPWLVEYTEDRDLWRWALPKSREINANLRSYPQDVKLWDDFALLSVVDGPDADSFQSGGEAILRRERQIVDDHVRHAVERDVCGYLVPVVNATVLFSEIAGELCKGKPFGACYFDRADGKRQWSLRSDENGVDVSLVARTKGGGGHRNAAGFEEVIA